MSVSFLRWFRWGVLAIMFGSMFWLSVGLHDVFASPDERANAFFSQTFAKTGGFCALEPMNDFAQGLVHPRSTVAPGECILPASFLGFPVVVGVVLAIVGIFGSLIAPFAMYAVTPILAVVAIACWWLLVRRLSGDERLADLAAFLALIHPAFWYYSARVMMHNVPFVSLLIIGAWVLCVSFDRRLWVYSVGAGTILGLALALRLSEAPLIACVVLLCVGLFWKRLHWKSLAISMVAAAVVLCGYLALNASVYGSAFATGYTLPDTHAIASSPSSADSDSTVATKSSVIALILPFGFHPRAIVRNVFEYGVMLYPALSVLALIGMILVLRTRQRSWSIIVGILVFAAGWMAVVYGSWNVADNIDPRAITIGNSHVRYWLPLFVVSSVFAAYALRSAMRRSRVWNAVGVGVIIAITILSAHTVFGGTDGLFATRKALAAAEEKRGEILAATGCDRTDADRPVIIVDHADKYLFPTCSVVVPLRSDVTYDMLPTLVSNRATYYVGLPFPQTDLEYLNTSVLLPQRLMIEFVQDVGDEALYRFLDIDSSKL